MNVAIISGSFDPITNGHMHIIKQASETFNSVIVIIATNPNKKYEFSIEQRKQMVFDAILEYQLSNVAIEILDESELTVEFAESHHANILVRGIRNSSDLEYEQDLMLLNHDVEEMCKHKMQTYFVLAPKTLSSISSTMIRNLLNNKKTYQLVSKYVPNSVYTLLTQIKGYNYDLQKC